MVAVSAPAEVAANTCEGPLVWFDTEDGAVLECSRCEYVVTTGNFHDERHAHTDLLRSPQ